MLRRYIPTLTAPYVVFLLILVSRASDSFLNRG
jgi:hypothetical protein